MKEILVFILIIGISFPAYSQINSKEKEKINWLSIKEIDEKLKNEPKPVLVDLYTDWCYWCKVMDNRTYQNANVISYINEHFYAVKLNAETKDSIEWNKQYFSYNPRYKVNQFAMFVTGGKLQFPSTIIFTKVNEPVSIPGYLRTGDIESLLRYFGEEVYNKMSYPQFARGYINKW